MPTLRRRDQADGGRRQVDVLLPFVPAPPAATPTAQNSEANSGVSAMDVSEAIGPPDGFSIGHWTDAEGATGCTVVIAPPGTRGGVDVRGGGPGTRETDVIGPFAGTHEVSGVALSGGSALGLAAAGGVVRWLEEHGRGYETPAGRVPIVPAAVVYDLAEGDPA